MESSSKFATFDTLTDLSHLSKGTKNHLKNVYGCLSLSMLSAAGGAYMNFSTDGLEVIGVDPIMYLLGCGFFMLGLKAVKHTPENFYKRLGMLVSMTFLMGAQTAPLISMFASINPSIPVTAFAISSSMFVAFSLSALFARRRSFLYLGGLLGTGLMVLIFASIFTSGVSLPQLSFGCVLMAGYVVYDTQLIVEKYNCGDTDFIWHSIYLFLDLLNLFERIMAILGYKESKKERKQK